jgi:hypothetical protein
MTIHDGGTFDWESAIQSSDSGDTWNIRFDFFAANGDHLFTMPGPGPDSWYSESIPDAHAAHNFIHSWGYKSSFYDQIASVKFDYAC